MSNLNEVFISVDVETAGPNPSQYALLSIGACTIGEPRQSFYVELKPDRSAFVPEALAICNLSLEKLAETGLEPAQALQQFADWVGLTAEGQKPIFVAFNAVFDWMFTADYFHRYLGFNPFGHAALDVKAYYMGLSGVSFHETSMRHIRQNYPGLSVLTHNALEDAVEQAKIFEILLADRPIK